MSNSLDSFPSETERVLERLRDEPAPAKIDFATDYEPKRRWGWPLFLLILTLISTFWAGVTTWAPEAAIEQSFLQGSAINIRQSFIANWQTGLVFSAALIGILLAHEMGHFLMTLVYRVQSSYPIFIPFPFNAFGTMGALIMMDGRAADRRQIFDIGIAGPLAGLAVVLPLAAIGLIYPSSPAYSIASGLRLGEPLFLQILDSLLGTHAMENANGFSTSVASPLLMASWIGLLVTGLNMMPMSQLDGGHVIFGLFGHHSIWIARAAFVGAIAYIVVNNQYFFAVMLGLVLLLRLRHPPSRDDSVQIGWPRAILGILSLSLPILCIPAQAITF